MAFLNKAKWVLGILIVFVLILSTNIIDRENFLRVKAAIITIYEDRLIANDLLFEMLESVQEKEIAAATVDSIFFLEKNPLINKDIKVFVSKFQQTKLTSEEETIFENLKDNIEKLKITEVAFVQSKFIENTALLNQVSKVKKNLHALSKIQLNEGGRQMSISKNAMETMELFTTIEINILIFLAILIQIVVIYNPNKK
jgi:hypothetical protein